MSLAAPQKPFLYLAPIKGITDATFRNTFFQHFGGFNTAMAPFTNPQKKSLYEDKMIRDVLPENNPGLRLIPQLLHTDPEDFLVLAKRLAGLGYTHINWNLGCPVPMVARKKRGSGLLPYPEEIIELLSHVMPRLEIALSIKTRLGFNDQSEIRTLLPQLNNFPLKEIIIHTRLGKQLYRGSTDPDGFTVCQELSTHTLAYNGDINDVETFRLLANRFPTVNRWMIGRGALMNPLLGETIKGYPQETEGRKRERLYSFHKALYNSYQERLSGSSHLLGRMKHLWQYFIFSFPGQHKYLKKILKAKRPAAYLQLVDHLFEAH